MKTQKGIALISMMCLGVLLITGAEIGLLYHVKKQVQKKTEIQLEQAQEIKEQEAKEQEKTSSQQDKELLKILPPKERTELENAFKEAQEAVKDIRIPNFTALSIDQITKSLDNINRQAVEQIKKHQEQHTGPDIDIDYIQPIPSKEESLSKEEIFKYYGAQHQQYILYQNQINQGLLAPGQPEYDNYLGLKQEFPEFSPQSYQTKAPSVYFNPLSNPDINPMANSKINPMADPKINPFANPNINPLANPSINPIYVPGQYTPTNPPGGFPGGFNAPGLYPGFPGRGR